jgi:hypothetical protein
MTKTESLIAQVYSAFNQRNIDGALASMSDSVSWPKASEGGRVVGKEEIRALEPPNGPFFRGRAATCPTSKKHRAFCYGEREEDARCGTYPEIDPCVPTLDRSRRKEQGKRKEDKKYG